MTALRRPNKYGANPTVVDNIRFASAAESRRYSELLVLQRGGVIRNLELQPVLVYYGKGNVPLFKYLADFAYFEAGGGRVYEDVKSKPTSTPVYRLKKKLIENQYHIEIREVQA